MTNTQSISVGELCQRLNIKPPKEIEGRTLRGVSTLRAATEHDVAYLVKEKFLAEARQSNAGLILVSEHIQLDHPAAVPVANVMDVVVRTLQFFYPEPPAESFIHPTAIIADGVHIGKDVHIGAHVVIEEGVRIGDRARIESLTFIGRDSLIGKECWFSSRISILHETEIGNRVRIHPGVVLGADGFRLEKINGRPQKIPQVGNVIIEDDVEIGANSTIDRASLTETRIGARTKIDNLVHIGHNVIVGSDCVIVAQVGIGGSTRIGRGVMIAGGVSIKDNVTIGDGSRIAGRSAVQNNLPPGSDVMGFPALPVKDYARFASFYRRFSQHWKKLKPLLSDGGAQQGKGDLKK